MKHSLEKLFVPVLAAVICLAGCSAGSNAKYESSDTATVAEEEAYYAYADFDEPETPAPMEMKANDGVYETGATVAGTQNAGETATQNAAAGRKIISSCTYDIQTNTFDDAVAALDALTAKYGAYCESSETDGIAEYANRTLYRRIRVPRDSYEAFRSETGSVGVIRFSSESNEDVSERYFDTEAHLKSAETREERLLAILEEADSLDNVLLLEEALEDVRYEIESYSGTLRKFDSLISYSTVNITIKEVIKPVTVQPTPKSFGQKFVQSASDGLRDFADGFGEFIIDLVYALPVLLLLAVIILLIVLVIRGCIRRAKKKKSQKVTPPEKNSGAETPKKD